MFKIYSIFKRTSPKIDKSKERTSPDRTIRTWCQLAKTQFYAPSLYKESSLLLDNFDPLNPLFKTRAGFYQWEPDSNEIFYYERRYDKFYNKLISESFIDISQTLDKDGYYFTYLPFVNKECGYCPESFEIDNYNNPSDHRLESNIKYLYPDLEINDNAKPTITYETIAQAVPLPPENISGNACLVRINRGYVFVKQIESKTKDELLEEICYFSSRSQTGGAFYRLSKVSKQKDEEADDFFDIEMEVELKKIRQQIDKLRAHGLSNLAIRKMIGLETDEVKPSRLLINKHHRIFLTDYGNKEIKLEPLQKIVFLLFLKHPEGIRFKELANYKQELYKLYLEIGGRTDDKESLLSINRLTSPMDNSINEKCSKIKRAFVSEICEEAAIWYYIDGAKGEPKKIRIPRELVTIETNI